MQLAELQLWLPVWPSLINSPLDPEVLARLLQREKSRILQVCMGKMGKKPQLFLVLDCGKVVIVLSFLPFTSCFSPDSLAD